MTPARTIRSISKLLLLAYAIRGNLKKEMQKKCANIVRAEPIRLTGSKTYLLLDDSVVRTSTAWHRTRPRWQVHLTTFKRADLYLIKAPEGTVVFVSKRLFLIYHASCRLNVEMQTDTQTFMPEQRSSYSARCRTNLLLVEAGARINYRIWTRVLLRLRMQMHLAYLVIVPEQLFRGFHHECLKRVNMFLSIIFVWRQR